jgi:hypothetical protein
MTSFSFEGGYQRFVESAASAVKVELRDIYSSLNIVRIMRCRSCAVLGGKCQECPQNLGWKTSV